MSRKARDKASQSVFGGVLELLLDGTGVFKRSEWADVLHVSTPAVSQWINDKTVPRADLLRMVLDILRTNEGAKTLEPLAAFEAILDKPSESISPIGSRFAPNLRSYLRVRSFSEIGRTLRGDIAREREIARSDRPKVQPEPISAQPGYLSQATWRWPSLVRERGPHGREQRVDMDTFAAGDHLVLVGTAGTGKSFLLARLVEQYSRWQFADRIDGWNLLEERPCIDVPAQIDTDPERPLVLDGLDDLSPERRKEAIECANSLIARYPSKPVVVGSRPVPELSALHGFDRYSIAPMSDAEVVAEVANSAMASTHPQDVEAFLCHMVERKNLKPAFRHPFFLSLALASFEAHHLTAFSDGKLVENYITTLLVRDQARHFKTPGDSFSTPKALLDFLGEVSLRLLAKKQKNFGEQELSRWAKDEEIDSSEVIGLLISLGLLIEVDRSYSFSHRAFLDFFAARRLNERSDFTNRLLKETHRRYRFGEAFRLACSLADDATPLLEAALSNDRHEEQDMALLARTIAQPLQAEKKVLQQGCLRLVSWLDKCTADWTVLDAREDPERNISRWSVCAKFGGRLLDEKVVEALRAVHQARSGPAREPLMVYLHDAKSSFLPVFAETLEIEGKLTVEQTYDGHHAGHARVTVDGLQLA